MVEINLLPWRDYVLVYQRKQLKKILLTAVLSAVFLVAAMHLLCSRQLHGLQIRKTQLDQDLSQYAAQQQLRASMRLLHTEEAGQSRSRDDTAAGKLFVELGKSRLSGVCFTEIVRDRNSILFAGQTRSAADLTDFLVNWNAAALFSELQIDQLQLQKSHLMQFRFRGFEGSYLPRQAASNGEHPENAI